MVLKKYQYQQINNPWDFDSVPMISLGIDKKKKTRSSYDSIQQMIDNFSKKNVKEEVTLRDQIKKARQIAYIEPWFQFFLPDSLKNCLFVDTIGYYYWVIAADKSVYASRFKFYQKEIRSSLEAHLNKISKKTWNIPEFKVVVALNQNKDSKLLSSESMKPKAIQHTPIHTNKRALANPNKDTLEDLLVRLQNHELF